MFILSKPKGDDENRRRPCPLQAGQNSPVDCFETCKQKSSSKAKKCLEKNSLKTEKKASTANRPPERSEKKIDWFHPATLTEHHKNACQNVPTVKNS
ncbi:MAG: hypothetical protein IIZ23_03540 [Ruminococcus sp.]|nr:hypothetical protein [Ruminococcus sp.]